MTLRRSLLRLVPAVALVLLAAWMGVAIHHHAEADQGRPCAVCIAGHAPASVASSAAPLPNGTIAATVAPPVEGAPSLAISGALRARAPPAC